MFNSKKIKELKGKIEACISANKILASEVSRHTNNIEFLEFKVNNPPKCKTGDVVMGYIITSVILRRNSQINQQGLLHTGIGWEYCGIKKGDTEITKLSL